MNRPEFIRWIDAYIQAQELGDVSASHPLWWAVEKFFELNETNPDICWDAILAIAERKPSEQVLGIVAAGPLEDLIEYHGPEFIDRIESEARANPVFRKMLSGVWESSNEDVWARVQQAR